MRIEFAPRAIADWDVAYSYYRDIHPQLAEAFHKRLQQAVDRLRAQPLAGPRVGDQARVLLMRRFPFKLFYAVGDGVVRILHIRHTSRRPWLVETD